MYLITRISTNLGDLNLYWAQRVYILYMLALI